MKTLVIVPCYNEDPAIINKTISEIKKYNKDILLIDDGSLIPVKTSVKSIRNNENKGKGYSLRKGFDYAIKNNFDAVITLDGDGEHDPSNIPEFKEKLNNYDFIVGERPIRRSISRKFLNFFSQFWFNLINNKIKDTQSGYRAIKVNLLKKMELNSDRFAIELETLLEAIKHSARITSIAITKKVTKKSHVSKQDYLKINKMFDEWYIKNKKYLKINLAKKLILDIFTPIGLKISSKLLSSSKDQNQKEQH
ncbi:MAG: glycosyltransferase family 2 protein [Candidatus Nanoarchaeia archaeon]|nr:glycosyltransferase family 2 protein [Candidatus Nanoarchaeia archaeon]